MEILCVCAILDNKAMGARISYKESLFVQFGDGEVGVELVTDTLFQPAELTCLVPQVGFLYRVGFLLRSPRATLRPSPAKVTMRRAISPAISTRPTLSH